MQYNDETVTNVDLTLGDEVISCRGASSDAAAPAGVLPGIAESGGSVELECFFDTDQVAGECVGMQLEPRFANGQHELGAQITTADGTVRQALATQMITLKNSNYVMIDHNPGSVSHIVGGVTFYGGPTTEDNVNTFDVCPVAFDGTVVGKIGLRGMTDTMQEEGDSYNDNLSFRTHRSGRYGEYNGRQRVDDEPPFTFTVLSSQNALTEDRNADGHGGHWIIQDGTISDPDGLDISSKFVPGDMENDLTKIGPIYFDFASPRVSGDSEVTIEGASIANVHYSGKRGTYDGRSQRFGVSGVTERGAGGVADVIAVGDCSISANTDPGRDGAGTAFQAIVEDAAAVGDLPEDDPDAGNLSDDGGVQCYTAELQALTDRMGNSRNLSRVRIQSAEFFGVDKTSPDVDDLVPDEELVLMDDATLTFEVEDPELETGEDGSGFNGDATRAFWGTSWSNRYFRTGYGDADDPGDVITVDGDVVIIETNTGVTAADRQRRHVVNVEVRDRAVPPNLAGATFAYTRDGDPPGITLSKSQSDIGRINTATVTVTVGGTISDANVIKTAELSIKEIALEDPAVDACEQAENLAAGRGNPVVRNLRDLENNTNQIVFDESFTLRQAEGMKRYCFWLASADVAVEANGRGPGNPGDYELGSFTVDWPDGEPPTPPGPTFEFTTLGDATASPPVMPAALTELEVTEGDATGTAYAVKLANTEETEATVTVTAPTGFTATPSTLTFPNTNVAGADTLVVVITAAHDLDIMPDEGMVTHSADDFEDASLAVQSNDDDFAITVDTESISEDAAAEEVTVTVTAGTAPAAETTVTVAIGYPTGDAETTPAPPTSVDVVIAAEMTSGEAEVEVDAIDDSARDEVNDEISLTVGASAEQGVYYVPASIGIMDDDPDITLSLDVTEVNEDAGTITVEITGTADSPVGGILNFSLGYAGSTASRGAVGSTAAIDDFRTPEFVDLQFNARATTATATVTIEIVDDGTDESNETIRLDDANGAQVGGAGKTYTVSPVTLTIIDNDDT
ncbi:hypothetical protein [Candidatus Palauibacter irciniicola]|uniref:hypothetical protein n=1 Tax=Candidatus Palauibacter irciniicola TaxID=3056733 RepID=UPI003B01A6D2